MQATITYTLTEAAQRAQMAATGQPIARKQVHTIEIDPADIDMLKADEAGNLSAQIDRTHINYSYEGVAAVCEAQTPQAAWEAYRAAYRERQAAYEAKRLAEEEDAARRLRETEAADAAAAQWIDAKPAGTETWRIKDDALAAAGVGRPNWNANLPLVAAAIERLTQRNKEAAAAQKAAAEAKAQAKQEYIASWIAEHGSADDREQFADGLLSRKTILSMIAARAFADLGIPEAFSYDDDFCRNSDCPCGEQTLDVLTRKHYRAWKTLKAKLPEGSTFDFHSVREHLGEDDAYEQGEQAGPAQTFVTLHVPVGPFVFDRNVKLEEQ